MGGGGCCWQKYVEICKILWERQPLYCLTTTVFSKPYLYNNQQILHSYLNDLYEPWCGILQNTTTHQVTCYTTWRYNNTLGDFLYNMEILHLIGYLQQFWSPYLRLHSRAWGGWSICHTGLLHESHVVGVR